MILPTKYMAPERTLLGVGADILYLLSEPKSVSYLWDEIVELRNGRTNLKITYDWFLLSLDLLFLFNLVKLENGKLSRVYL